ncbi:MAG: hypothetical protein Q8P00_00825, partial [Dehalococcoidia bacterium]|nr:hypothetical protein [Dehalococcoidia bacterium]
VAIYAVKSCGRDSIVWGRQVCWGLSAFLTGLALDVILRSEATKNLWVGLVLHKQAPHSEILRFSQSLPKG